MRGRRGSLVSEKLLKTISGELVLCRDGVSRPAQIAVAVAHHRRHFGRDPAGIWLPECGYYPGLEQLLVDEGLAYFFVDAHGLANAVPRPLYGPYAPVVRMACSKSRWRVPPSVSATESEVPLWNVALP